MARDTSEQALDVLVALAKGAPSVAPLDAAAVLYEESGWDPARHNASGAHYYGLNQMGVDELKSMGLTPETWLAMTAAAQLPLVFRFWRTRAVSPRVMFASRAHLLAANFLPGRMPSDPADVAHVLTYKGETYVDRQGVTRDRGWYEPNAMYDPDHTGKITIASIAKYLDAALDPASKAQQKLDPAARWERVHDGVRAALDRAAGVVPAPPAGPPPPIVPPTPPHEPPVLPPPPPPPPPPPLAASPPRFTVAAILLALVGTLAAVWASGGGPK